mmetsp:Transcript_17279/g.52243  ORF Transcript_17279/g.52243 Transcript_17279/m.52243 type:complete len:136 (-) Transcript_17279:508-915(-)
MCGGDMSILGALDFACLCCVCAGVCAAVAMRPESARERRANVRAFTVNMCMGDFVEACYPYMVRDWWVRVGAMSGAATAGVFILTASARSSAYLPLPLAIAAADATIPFAAACCTAFALPFTTTLLRRRNIESND